MRRRVSFIAMVLVALLVAIAGSTSASASIDNKGTEFLLGFMPQFSSTLEVHLTSDVATTVTLEHPVGTILTTHAVVPGTVTVASVPSSADDWTINAVGSKLVRVSASDEFVAYMVNRASATSDAALGLPVDTMNTEYIVLDYNPRFIGAEFLVYAAFDGTTVDITPSTAIVGHVAGTTFSVSLDAGEGYFARSSSTAASNTLTGTTISADRPVGLTNGNGCTQVPTGTTACDHIFEVAQPVQSWGTTVGVANLPKRAGSIYRILASEDGTTVTQDGAFLASLDRGDFHETAQLGGNHMFVGDKPIYVAQFMPGQDAPGSISGDPAMGNMIPFDQYLNAYTFSTVGGAQFAENFVTIIAKDADVGSLTLDGSPVPAASYSPVPGSGFSAAVLPLTDGTHTTSSTDPHGITVEGYNGYDSYIYPGGALFQFINPVGDENNPVVTCNLQSGDPPTVTGTATDNLPSEDVNDNGVLDPGEDLNGNGQIDEDTGIFFVELTGAVNLDITVAAFVPGDGSVGFTLSLIDDSLDGTGTVLVTDGAGNESTVDCSVTAIPSELVVDIDIKPGSDPNSLNLNGNGVVPVGVFGSNAFNVADINVSSVVAGVDADSDGEIDVSALPAAAVHGGHIEDIDGDGINDIVFHFREFELGIDITTPGNEILDVLLVGELNDTTAFAGVDVVRITPNNADKSRGKGGKGPK